MFELFPDFITSTICMIFAASSTFLFVEAVRSRNENQAYLTKRNFKFPDKT